VSHASCTGPSSFALVALDGEHVFGLAIHDLLRNVLLTPHRVDGDDLTLEQQGIEQFRNGRDFIASVGRTHLPEHHTQPTSVRRDQ
jgi:hypothetical protein